MMRLLYGLVALGLLWGVAGQAKADYVFTTLDPPGTTFVTAFAINDPGQIVGRYAAAAGVNHGFLYDPSDGSFTTLDPPGSTDTAAFGINASGQIVGRYTASGIQHGWLRNGDGSYTTLDVSGSTATFADSINASGEITGWYSVGAIDYAVLLSGGSYSTLNPPGSTSSRAFGINDLDQIVGPYVDASGTTHGYLLMTDGSYTTLDPPGSTFTWAVGINNSGQIVGQYIDAGGTSHGYLLSGGSYTTLDVPGSTLTRALAINASGQIVGDYLDAGGMRHGYLAVPVPTLRIETAMAAVSGTPLDVTITALDPSGNIDANYQGTVTFSTTDPDPGVVLPADYTFTTGDGGDNGVHTFPGGVTLVTVGDQTLTVTDPVSGIIGSVIVTVGPGP